MGSKKTSMLWGIKHPSFSGVSFVFGTMHVQDGRAFGQLEKVKEKIIECEAFALEFNLEDSRNTMDGTLTQLPDHQQLRGLMSFKKFQKLRKVILKSTGFDLNHSQRTLPFLTVGAISGFILQREMPTSLDEQLWAFAKSEGKQLLGIETLEEQLSVLSEIPLNYQVKMLIGLGENIKKTRKELLRLTDYYQNEDLHQLHRAVKRQAGGLRKLMLYTRNEIMAERIFDTACSQTSFCGIGAGHLGGGKGVLRLLKKKGVSIFPL